MKRMKENQLVALNINRKYLFRNNRNENTIEKESEEMSENNE
jgi:hypothetical protein